MKRKNKKTIYRVSKHKLQKVLADKSIPPGAKVILFNLIYRLGGKDYSFPSQEKIGKDIGLGARQVRNHLRVLKEKGIITWERGAINPKTGKKVNSNSYILSNLLFEQEVFKRKDNEEK